MTDFCTRLAVAEARLVSLESFCKEQICSRQALAKEASLCAGMVESTCLALGSRSRLDGKDVDRSSNSQQTMQELTQQNELQLRILGDQFRTFLHQVSRISRVAESPISHLGGVGARLGSSTFSFGHSGHEAWSTRPSSSSCSLGVGVLGNGRTASCEDRQSPEMDTADVPVAVQDEDFGLPRLSEKQDTGFLTRTPSSLLKQSYEDLAQPLGKHDSGYFLKPPSSLKGHDFARSWTSLHKQDSGYFARPATLHGFEVNGPWAIPDFGFSGNGESEESCGEPASQEATSEWLPGEGQDVNPPRIVEFEGNVDACELHDWEMRADKMVGVAADAISPTVQVLFHQAGEDSPACCRRPAPRLSLPSALVVSVDQGTVEQEDDEEHEALMAFDDTECDLNLDELFADPHVDSNVEEMLLDPSPQLVADAEVWDQIDAPPLEPLMSRSSDCCTFCDLLAEEQSSFVLCARALRSLPLSCMSQRVMRLVDVRCGSAEQTMQRTPPERLPL
mmetsp:Transcript_56246/g.150265  ORF Transcript_56246/g.150265 Transcript_56246/m.150265 type:complete len:505 (-) Transcript_56246:110-1624(-)|eukprot:CAMPEP_0194542664 /NCGR_PEP_ID=MMETSP0253-20130528/84431_1 /TAXON_ID=2966 /ORGANISM="Noctiluca scintillans" /LENGTH=504 /DNA_ID=CAMNT_0039389315 /DNA_START=38 /DNA_END=1552 /DNA_ORIENTATION=+